MGEFDGWRLVSDERQPVSEAQLDQIEQRCDAASKPPWQSFIEGRDHWGGDNFIRVGGLDDSEPDMYVSRALAAKLALHPTPTSTSSPTPAKTFRSCSRKCGDSAPLRHHPGAALASGHATVTCPIRA